MLYLRNLLIAALVLPFQYVVVPILLLTRWNGRTTWFGNSKHGKGHDHFEQGRKGFWPEFVWLTYRNPINNLLNHFGKPAPDSYVLTGNPNTSDNKGGETGAYAIITDTIWEFFYVKPYKIPFMNPRCVRIRLGWKIHEKLPGELCPMVMAVNPIQNYYGV